MTLATVRRLPILVLATFITVLLTGSTVAQVGDRMSLGFDPPVTDAGSSLLSHQLQAHSQSMTPHPQQPPANADDLLYQELSVTAESVAANLDSAESVNMAAVQPGWWQAMVPRSLRNGSQDVEISLEETLYEALANSRQVKVFRQLPPIRQTAIVEANAAFDWTTFLSTQWDDVTSDPIGNTLTAGSDTSRFRDQANSAIPAECVAAQRPAAILKLLTTTWLSRQQLRLLRSWIAGYVANHAWLHPAVNARAWKSLQHQPRLSRANRSCSFA